MDELRIRGRQGPAVQALRQALAQQLGGDAAAFGALAEGDTLDAACEAAARRWQSGVGLIADGVIGPRCLRLLGLSAATPMALSLSLTTVRPLFPATKPANIDRYLPYVAAALQTLALVDRPMILAALATIRAESEGFVPIAEMPSPLNTLPGQAPFSAYDHRPALGNTQDGDGARFKGRGFVQLTGRANYGRYGARLGVDLLGDPDLANAPEIAALLLAHFLADRAEAMRRALACGDYAAARRLVNGGRHGLPRFRSVFELAGRGAPGQAIERPTGAVAPVGAVAAVAAAAAKKPTPPLTARKDAIDLRDRPYQPPAASLLEAFPRDEDVPATAAPGSSSTRGRRARARASAWPASSTTCAGARRSSRRCWSRSARACSTTSRAATTSTAARTTRARAAAARSRAGSTAASAWSRTGLTATRRCGRATATPSARPKRHWACTTASNCARSPTCRRRSRTSAPSTPRPSPTTAGRACPRTRARPAATPSCR